MQIFRKTIFWVHLISGIISGVAIFVMCVTGALLAFQPDVLDFVESNARYVVPDNNQKLSVGEILSKIKQSKPNAKVTEIMLNNNPISAISIELENGEEIFVNPYTAEITGGEAKNWREFFHFNVELHRWLALSGDNRFIGKAINDACNFAFLLLAITGIYIWFPRRLQWSRFKPVIWFRRGLGSKARDFNWHNVIGFWSSTVLIILTLTGVVISYQWAGKLVYTVTNNELPPQNSRPNKDELLQTTEISTENLNVFWQKAEKHTAWKSISLSLPIADNALNFVIDEGIYANKFGRSRLTIDATNGEITKWESYGEQNAARRLRNWIRFTHTGESFGFIGQFIGFLACIGGIFLVYTGFSLSWRRYLNWRN